MSFKTMIQRIPFFGEAVRRLYWRLLEKTPVGIFPGSDSYWKKRYANDGNSGVGSYGKFAEFKADVINALVQEHQIHSVIEFGCGDGNQLKMMNYPTYIGFDISQTAIDKCKEIFKSDASKSFKLMGEYGGEKADLTLSLDVIYHLVEDAIFEHYMRRLFDSTNSFAIIYSSNTDNNRGYKGTHVRHRQFTTWVDTHAAGWRLLRHVPNRYPYKGDYRQGSFADFFIYRKS